MKCYRYIVLVFLILLVSGCSSKEKVEGDFYSYINKDSIDNIKLNNEEFTYNTFVCKQESIDKEVDSIVESLIKDNKNISILYNKLMDNNTRDKEGLSNIKYYLNLIDSSKNIEEFIDNAIKVEESLNIPIFISLNIMADFKDTSKNMLYLMPMGLSFDVPSDYYTSKDFIMYHSLVKQYEIKLLKEYGYDKDKARKISKDVDELYTSIARKSKSQEEFKDIEKLYNIISKEELKKIYNKLDSNYFDSIPDNIKLSIVDSGNYKAINDILVNDNLNTLKEIVKLKILESFGEYISTGYAKIFNDLNNEELGIKKEFDIKKNSLSIIKSYFNDDINNIYINNNKDDKKINIINNLVKDSLLYYEDNLNNKDFLSKTTKEKAINKLKNMKVNIGMNNDIESYTNEYNLKEDDSLIECIIKMNKVNGKHSRERLFNNKKVAMIGDTTFNAFYNVQDNSINFPIAILDMIDSDNYYKNLGSIGMIIAHEITHAFDSNGSKFDEKGNLVNWWTKEDRDSFNKKRQEVIDYYNNFEVIDGIYIDGELTVDENIADLGAINCITNIAKKKKASNSDIKTMFESFAKMWLSKDRDDYLKMLLQVDTHSPNKFRVNGTLYANDLFYEVYNISRFNDMYVKKESRVSVW